MVSEEHRTGLYVAVPLYFCVIAGAAYWAHRRMEILKHEGVSDQLAAHYLGGRNFGPLLTAGTLFASLFSGYTVVGVPNEAFRDGWKALRWMAAINGLVLGYFGTGLRFRKVSLIRNHHSPVDFITDRYQSQLLRYMLLLLQLGPTIIYLAAQVIAIKGTFNSIFELDPDAAYPVIIIMTLILLFEWVGGLNSVALTDSVQAIVMVLSFVILPSVVCKNFGGWRDLDPDTYPKPQFYQTMSQKQQWDFWQFSLVSFGFFTLPHFVQRTYAAKDIASLKAGYAVMTIGPWFTLFVGVFLGTIGVTLLVDEDGNSLRPADPFSAILEEIMNLGGIARVAGVIAVTASLAAIMSTADSLIIAISQLVTVEIFYPLRPLATPEQIAWIGKFVSLGAVVLSLLIGILWDEGITDLSKIQFSLSAQALPSFILGLFSTSAKNDIHPWCLAAGALSGTIFVVAFFWGYIKPVADSLAIDSGMMGFLLNITVACVLETIRRTAGGTTMIEDGTLSSTKDDGKTRLLYPGRPQWDIPKLSRFGNGCLSPQLVWKAMEGVNEPLTNVAWFFMFLFVVTAATPLTAELQPPLDDNGNFVSPPPVVNGLPWWAFKIILVCILTTSILLMSIYRMPDEFPVDTEKIEREGIDASLVEMTREEMGRRTSYDETNILIQRRRSTISQTMEQLGMTKSEPMEFAPTRSQRQLALLATQSIRALDTSSHLDFVKEEEDDKDDAGVAATGENIPESSGV